MDVQIGEANAEQVIFELFEDICPKTCANFKGLCEGVMKAELNNTKIGYTGSEFARVAKGMFV
jgi:cyclophilin family peptidyl-prolyl cis-trans isomerase